MPAILYPELLRIEAALMAPFVVVLVGVVVLTLADLYARWKERTRWD